ncbi:MAG: AraC family transcriptional regulator ligand-binding domain-containing protein [Pseudooceanicola sp.]|nr:AraC family transcriptional regulator ligand-binding domain-containing protein [Pseudooceanicola sp.]
MPSVTIAFVRAMARAVGVTLREDGAVLRDGQVVWRFARADGHIGDIEFFDFTQWVRDTQPDDLSVVAAYARTIQADELGVLGLAFKTAPTLRASLQRVERYFRILTDTAVYRLDETRDPAHFAIEIRTPPHSVLDLRNECALAGFARNMRNFVGEALVFDAITFRHPCRGDPADYAALLGCPVRFEAERDAIVLGRAMLDLPNRLGDAAVNAFLTAHLERELGPLDDRSLRADLLRLLTPALSNGVPQAAAIARQLGMSERTLYRRLAEEGLTFRDVLVEAQLALAQELLRDGGTSIAEIAFLTGFAEQSTFSRAFKRWVGKAPAQFRQQPVG